MSAILIGLLTRGSAWLAALPWRRLLPWAALVLGIGAALWAVERHGYRRGELHERPIAFAAGEKAERATWLAAQAAATNEHRAIARATEARQAAVAVNVGENYAHDVADLHAGYRQLRDAARGRGAAGGADLPGIPGAAGAAAQPGGADIVVADPAGDRATAALITGADLDKTLLLLEEGDVYRLRVLAWQQWYAGVSAAAQPPPD